MRNVRFPRAPLAVVLASVFIFPVLSWGDQILVSTINGYYDVDGYDTPSLHVSNTTGFDFTDVTLTLTGYQGINNGLTQTAHMADVAAGSTAVWVWGGNIPGEPGCCGVVPGNLFSYDYDDEYVNTFTPQTGKGLSASGLVDAPQCASQANIYGWGFCADVGNFYVTITADWNGQQIYSQFSPDPNLAGAGNAAGVFVGWEGLDPDGWSETVYDAHNSGGPNGVLANIYVGTPPPVGTPEPADVSLLMGGLLLIGAALLRRERMA
jgi:hypothetical protein